MRAAATVPVEAVRRSASEQELALVKPRPPRDQSLDFVKGVLVVIMVIYHWMNYFVDVRWDVYRYLRFLTPSFIFITGFIIARIYSPEQFVADRRIARRLLQRGFKILALFTVLNVLAATLLPRSGGSASGVGAFVASAYSVYITGNGRAIFDVLVPIAYFLLCAPLVMTLGMRTPLAIPLVTIILLVLASVTSLTGHVVANLELLALAMTGMLTGKVPPQRLARVSDSRVGLAVAYILYLAAITAWNVAFPLQIVGVCLTLLLIHQAACEAGSRGALQRWIIELGRYSLFAYIAQVAVLQVLRRVLKPFDLHALWLLLPFLAALVLTAAAVALVATLRKHSLVTDRLYRAVFA
jgi:peptidoglycan/LPS O-acetylase OafA/YrhL